MAQLLAKKPKNKHIEKNALEADAKMRMESWRKEFSIIRFSDPLSLVNKDAYSDGAELLSQMVAYCEERDFKPVFVMPPVSEAMREQFTPEMKQLFIDDFVKKGFGVKAKFLDYFADARFSDDLFQNSFILNGVGARKFTEVVLKEAGLI